ncbi:hypothetical protein M728_003856 (plasmid) [Ensifer sp. WSM1721]
MPIPRATSGGGEGAHNVEAMREEVHRFDEMDYTTGTRKPSDGSLQACYVLHAQRAAHRVPSDRNRLPHKNLKQFKLLCDPSCV